MWCAIMNGKDGVGDVSIINRRRRFHLGEDVVPTSIVHANRTLISSLGRFFLSTVFVPTTVTNK